MRHLHHVPHTYPMSKERVPPDRRLLGTWRSDRRLTFKHYTPPPKMTLKGLRFFKSIFGELTVRWGTHRVYTNYEGAKRNDPYKVIARDSVSVVVECFHPLFGEERLIQIFFEDDHYYFWTGNMREFFRRVK
jgi:hypothetical protein